MYMEQIVPEMPYEPNSTAITSMVVKDTTETGLIPFESCQPLPPLGIRAPLLYQ